MSGRAERSKVVNFPIMASSARLEEIWVSDILNAAAERQTYRYAVIAAPRHSSGEGRNDGMVVVHYRDRAQFLESFSGQKDCMIVAEGLSPEAASELLSSPAKRAKALASARQIEGRIAEVSRIMNHVSHILAHPPKDPPIVIETASQVVISGASTPSFAP